ncbi:MAG: DUF4398 domain-containing protein [Gammaproteobacteria bacterium]
MRQSSAHSPFRVALGAGILACTLALSACVSPPVQAMSNARQAISVAEQAGAAQYASQLLGAARHWLSDAESALKNGKYNRAQWSAQKAEKAARQAAAESRAAHPPPPASSAEPQRSPPSPATASDDLRNLTI